MSEQFPPIVIEEITDSTQLAEAEAQREQFDRNAAWLQVHASEVYAKYRGRCICIAGEELFEAATAKEALALATAAHPEDKGRFVQYIPKDKVALELFAVIVDRPTSVVSLIGQRHVYRIEAL